MSIYILRRLMGITGVLVVISMLVFAITQIMPGDVANVLAGQFADDATIAAIEERLGLKDPFYVQYFNWAVSALQGDFGELMVMEQPVSPMIAEAFGRSLVLAFFAFILVVIFGIGIGVWSAVRRDKPTDHALSMFSYLGISVPEFFWGIVCVLLFARLLGWLPSGGAGNLSEDGLLGWSAHLVLPVLTLTFTLVAHVSRLTRSSMIEALDSQYVLNARAKGLPERHIVRGHALRNALLPSITVLAIDVGWLLGNIVVVEAVFSYPGLGRLLLFAIERHDLPLIQAGILVIALVYCLANLAADLLYAFLNPKIRYGQL